MYVLNKLTEKEICESAIGIQNGCNILAIAIFLADALRNLSRQGLGSKELNHHPAVILTVDKLLDLSQGNYLTFETYQKSYDACKEVSV